MKRILHFNNIGSRGIIRDPNPVNLPASEDDFAWSDGLNTRFRSGKAERLLGEATLLSVTRDPIWFKGTQLANGENKWVIFTENTSSPPSDQTLLRVGNLLTTDITTYGPVASLTVKPRFVTGDKFGDFFVFTADRSTGQRAPRQFLLTEATASVSFLSYDASAGNTWDTVNTAGNTCTIIKEFGQFLVAFDITENDVAYPNMVWWSTDAAAGSLPGTWDYADTSENAGRTELIGGGSFVDFFKLRDLGIIYKQNKVWTMQLGGTNVFQFRELFTNDGMLWRDCCGVLDDKHVVFGSNDIYIHDGVSKRSLLTTAQRREIFKEINRAAQRPAVVAASPERGEVWISYAVGTDDYPTTTLVYNVEENTLGEADSTQEKEFFAGGPVVSLSASGTAHALRQHIVMTAGGVARNLFIADESFTLQDSASAPRAMTLTRTGLDCGDPSRVKTVRRIYPRITSGKDADILSNAPHAHMRIRTTGMMDMTTSVAWSDWRRYHAEYGAITDSLVDGSTSWTNGTGWSGSGATLTGTAVNGTRAYVASGIITPGYEYFVYVRFTAYTAGNVAIYLGTASDGTGGTSVITLGASALNTVLQSTAQRITGSNTGIAIEGTGPFTGTINFQLVSRLLGRDKHVSFSEKGKYLGVEIESVGYRNTIEVAGFSMEVEYGGHH